MKAWLDWQAIQSLSASGHGIITALSVESVVFIQACGAFYNNRRNWLDGENDISDAQWDTISKLIGQTELDLMSPLVGIILPSVLASISGLSLLPCDGTVYNKADYPLLYEKIDTVYIIDADTFRVPDLRDVFMRGASASNPIGTTGGESAHTLTIDEMPSHSHSNSPHSHTEISAIPTIINGGLEAPASAATPSAATTGLSAITIDSTGGGQSHNNLPPFESVSFVIVAG